MKKILSWIKKNILGLEPPKRKKKKTPARKSSSKKPSKKQAVKKAPAKKIKPAPVKKKELKPAPPAKNFKKNTDQLLKVSKDYLKKPAKAAAVVKPEPEAKPLPSGKRAGVITHFFPNVRAAIIKVSGSIALGDQIHFFGDVTDFKVTVKSMQMNREPIEKASKGQEIGIQVPDKVREGDLVFKIARSKK